MKRLLVLFACSLAISAPLPALSAHALRSAQEGTPPPQLVLSHQGRLLNSPDAQFKAPNGARGVKVRFPWLPGGSDFRTRGMVPFSQVTVAFTKNGLLLGKPELSRVAVDEVDVAITGSPFTIHVRLSFRGTPSAPLAAPEGADDVSVFLYGGAYFSSFQWTQQDGPIGQSIAIGDLDSDGIAIGDPGVNGN